MWVAQHQVTVNEADKVRDLRETRDNTQEKRDIAQVRLEEVSAQNEERKSREGDLATAGSRVDRAESEAHLASSKLTHRQASSSRHSRRRTTSASSSSGCVSRTCSGRSCAGYRRAGHRVGRGARAGTRGSWLRRSWGRAGGGQRAREPHWCGLSSETAPYRERLDVRPPVFVLRSAAGHRTVVSGGLPRR